MNKIKEYKELIIVLILILGIFIWFQFRNTQNINYNNEISKQDLKLKCLEIYNQQHSDLEEIRYGIEVNSADSVIWSSKTKTCLTYYNVRQQNSYDFLFEVWDYTNNDLVLSYSSNQSDQCMNNNVKFSIQNFIYKYDKNLEGNGCDFMLMEKGIDLLINFENAMLELGFKK